MQEAKMKKFPVFFAAAAALIGSSAIALAQDYDQYQGQPSQDNRNMQQRGMDALGQFLGTNSGQAREVSPDDIVRDLERRNFHNISEPVRRGPVYMLYAVDPDGRDVELSVDADSGRIVDRRFRG
jgi:hypothetical protein